MKNFFAELKRRNVYKVGVAYAVVAWLLIQIATQVFPFFEIPNWAVRLIVLLLAIGFPIALVISWAFEMTLEGMKRTENILPQEKLPSWSRRKFAAFFGGLALLGLALFAFPLLRSKPPDQAVATDKSIAVLQFENRSEDKANAYFADGIQEEILTRLARIGALKVISATSTGPEAGKPVDLSDLGRQLGVDNILAGSVQKAGEQVRVNVRLVQAATNAQLWGEVYDRKLTDIFAVESEIAQAIASTLQAKLTGQEQKALTARPTDNTDAHQLYLRGRFFWNKRTAENLKKAVECFDQAIAADPKYALAYAGLADAYVLQPAYGAARPEDAFSKAKTAAQKAVELEDSLAEAHASLGKILWNADFDFPQSLAEFERSIQLNPRYPTAHHWYGNSPLLSLGRFEQAIAEMKRALELDPLSLILNADLGNTLHTARRYDEAIAQLRRTIELDPMFYYAHLNLGQALELKGERRAAIGEYEKARELNDDPMVLAQLGHAYGANGNGEDAERILQQLHEQATGRYVPKYAFALVELGLGRKEQALGFLEESFAGREARSIAYIRVDPFLDPLRGHPRFEALASRVLALADKSDPRFQKLMMESSSAP